MTLRAGVRTFRFSSGPDPYDSQRFAANALSAGRFNSFACVRPDTKINIASRENSLGTCNR